MNNSPNKLLQYIEDAKTWLDKAEDEFNNSNSARGELILSLAQAEVKHAWELSRGQCVSSHEKTIPIRRTAWLIPMAAGLCILLIGGGLFLSAKILRPGSGLPATRLAKVHHPVQPIVSPVSNIIPEHSAPVKSPVAALVPKPVVRPVAHETVPEKVASPEPAATIQPVTGSVVAANADAAHTDAAQVDALNANTAKEKTVAEAVKPSPPEPVRPASPVQEAAAKQEHPKPALQLPVEDDLTNMAAHSLKTADKK